MRPHDAHFMVCNLDSLRQGPQMIAPKSAVLSTHLLPRGCGHPAQMVRRKMLARVLDRALRALGIDARLVPGRRQLGDALSQGRIVEIGNPAFDGVIEAFQSLLRFRRPLGQLIGRIAAARVSLFPTVQMRGQKVFQPLRIEQPAFKVLRNQMIELVHPDRQA